MPRWVKARVPGLNATLLTVEAPQLVCITLCLHDPYHPIIRVVTRSIDSMLGVPIAAQRLESALKQAEIPVKAYGKGDSNHSRGLS